jgi:steroid delta-isomerase-like uncharacterized protein
MTREAVIVLMQRRTAALNAHDVPALGRLYSIDCRVESPMAAGVVHGRQAVGKVYAALFDAFPDLRFVPDMMVVDGEQVAVSGQLEGTYSGGFLGLPASGGKPIRVPVVTISTVHDDEIVTERRVYDFTGMLIQAGIFKAGPV